MSKGFQQTFSQRYTNGQKHMKRCSTSLSHQGTQIKITVKYHFTLIRMAVIIKVDNSKCWWECGAIRTFMHCWWESKMVYTLLKHSMAVLQKVTHTDSICPSIQFLGTHPKVLKTNVQTKTCTPMCAVALFVIV